MLRFSNLLEGLTELRKALILMVDFIAVKGYRLKLAKRKGAWCKIQEKADASFQVSPFSGVARGDS